MKPCWLVVALVLTGCGAHGAYSQFGTDVKACKAGQAAQCLSAGQSLARETDTKKRNAGIRYLKLACDNGLKRGCKEAVELLDKGTQTPLTAKLRLTLLRRGCFLEEGTACLALGRHFKSDRARAVQLFARGCRAGNLDACQQGAELKRVNDAMPKSRQSAQRMFRLLCKQGLLKACVNLGMMLQNRRGSPRHSEEVTTLFTKACDGGVLRGCYQLGRLLLRLEPARAENLLNRACKGDVGAACVELGRLYLGFLGRPANIKAAIVSLKRACQLGEAIGCFAVATVHYKSSPPKMKLVTRYYLKACHSGHAHSCYVLGRLYREGKQIPKDRVRAQRLFQRACDAAHRKACGLIESPKP